MWQLLSYILCVCVCVYLTSLQTAGVVYHLKKEYIKAEEEYRYALNMDPDLAIAKDNLQKLMKTRKKCVSK